MPATYKTFLPLIILFAILNLFIFGLSAVLEKLHADRNLILGANLFFLLLSVLSMSIQIKGMRHTNPHVFVRSVMSGMLIKMVLCIAAVILYVYASGDAYSKNGIFISLFFYLFYLAVEVYAVMKLNRKKNA